MTTDTYESTITHPYTPGPWKVVAEPGEARIWVRAAYEGECDIAEIDAEGVDDHGQALGDARLIAAAPMMAETLAYLDEVLGDQSEQTFERELIRIRAAIDAATGGQTADEADQAAL